MPFRKQLEGLAFGQNPVFSTAQRKNSRFKPTIRHSSDSILESRLVKASEEAWSHMSERALLIFWDQLERSATIAADVLRNNGEVKLEDDGGLVDEEGVARHGVWHGLIEFKWLALEIHPEVSQHPFFAQGEAEVSDQVAGSKHLNAFRKVVLAVDAICNELLSLAECALVNNVERLRNLHHDKQWSTAELKKMMGFTDRLECFFAPNGIRLSGEFRDVLAELVDALQPAFTRGQQQFYGAMRVLVDLYAEGKHLSDMQNTVTKILTPAEANNIFFALLRRFVETATAGEGVSESSGPEACLAAAQGVAEVLEQWPMEKDDSGLIVGSALVK